LERRRLEGLKDEFVSTVSHELRTPLTAIRGTLGLMAGGALGEVPDRWQKPLETASRSAARLGRLIDDILDIEKMAAGRLELTRVRLDMVAVVRDALTDNAGYAGGYGVRFELNALVDLAPVLADFDRIRQVIDNLLSNAAKYGPRRSSVDIDVTTDGSSVTVGVRDHGEGIPADFRDRIFEPFARADSSTTRKRGGTGLGLNIARKIVEDHGGEIGFDSSDEGTRFWFRLDSAE
jgi:signal transduction histidine kinase